MTYVMLWVSLAPIYLGDYGDLQACERAKQIVAEKVYAGTSPEVMAELASKVVGKRIEPAKTVDSIICLPKY